ncbi:hypothetical protein BT63DRAFT_479682 [Microthyrium microscopicum]|uniref:Mus7/MMS22 family-domain-containing protein n=1 Tax=Microthyrium microscopicum TaxID=703497 RepID=A0A6A6UAW5_9PEZI|nr:hypothetical protein BT63DRAFT_479682 [Microthyrium microscopicum]
MPDTRWKRRREERWRSRDFVPDSEDEDTAESIGHADITRSVAFSQATKPSAPPVILEEAHQDDDSSELSDCTDVPSPSPENRGIRQFVGVQITLPAAEQPARNEAVSANAEEDQEEAPRHTRDLRDRNFRQRHPYRAELLQHAALVSGSMRAEIPTREPPIPDASSDEEYSSDGAESITRDSLLKSSSPNQLRQLSEGVPQTLPSSLPSLGDDDLPDLDTIFKYVKAGQKGKLLVDSKTKHKDGIAPSTTGGRARSIVSHVDVYDVVSSSSEKENHVPARTPARPVFRHLEPPKSQTPKTVIKLTPRASGGRRHQQVCDDSTDDELAEVWEAARKIKGVLPASYVLLDLKKQQNAPNAAQQPHRRITQAPPHSPVRGVAQPTKVSANAQGKLPQIPMYSSESDDAEDVSAMAAPEITLTPQHVGDLAMFDADPGPAMEEDLIDFDGPSNSRHRKRKSAGNQQGRLRASKKQRTLKGFVSSSSSKPNSSNRPRTKSRGPSSRKIGVLDFESDSSPSRTTPDFLRVAKRQARKDKDLARHRPSGKHIRLRTREDTADAQEVLTRWRKGKIKRRYVARPANGNLPESRSSIAKHAKLQNLSMEDFLEVHRLERMRPIVGHLKPDSAVKTAPKRLDAKSSGRRLAAFPTNQEHPSLRTAQLESLESAVERQVHKTAFHSGLRQVNLNFATSKQGKEVQGQIIHHTALKSNGSTTTSAPDKNSNTDSTAANTKRSSTRPKKRIAQHLPVHRKEYRQPSEPLSTNFESSDPIILDSTEVPPTNITGFAKSYSIDLDIHPVPNEAAFQNTTFLGSGEFRLALHLEHRDLDVDVGEHEFKIGHSTYIWSQWGERMKMNTQEFYRGVYSIIGDLDESPSHDSSLTASHNALWEIPTQLRAIASANSAWVSFSDPIDRYDFVAFMASELDELLGLTTARLGQSNSDTSDPDVSKALVRISVYLLTLLAQAKAIGGTHHDLKDIISKHSRVLLKAVFRLGLKPARDFLEEVWSDDLRKAGVSDDFVYVEAIVILRHVLDTTEISFWDSVNAIILLGVDNFCSIPSFEERWRDTYTLLSLLGFNDLGQANPTIRFTHGMDNWTIPQRFCQRVFQLYGQYPRMGMNEYIRTHLRRVIHLINRWGWKQCDQMISTLFNFFVRTNKLAPLHLERITDSPYFLGNLDKHPSLDAQDADRSFDLFLKIIATRLHGLRATHPEKASDLVYRLIPNHDRDHSNTQTISHDDLAALRNHQDLLCTLFWQAPQKDKLRPFKQLAGLVDHRTSHQRVCLLNVQAFKNLVRYQFTASSQPVPMEKFSGWIKEIIAHLLEQFHIARSATELERASNIGSAIPSSELVQTTIRKNQKPVLRTLGEVVTAMGVATQLSKSQLKIADFLKDSEFEKIFMVSADNHSEVNSLMVSAIQLYNQFLDLPDHIDQHMSEESQDYYGDDFSYVDLEFVEKPLFEFLSTSFEADKSPNDLVAPALVKCWVKYVSLQVQRNALKSWEDFIGSYGECSWERFPSSHHKSKYGALFYASLLSSDKSAFKAITTAISNKEVVIRTWLVSLVERVSRLKYQHELTSSILNSDASDPLLSNLPFWKDKDGQYRLTFTELQSRRLALISSLLENMSLIHDTRHMHFAPTLNQTEIKACLKAMMEAMKSNYKEMKQKDSTSGDYIHFVQQIISLLQQYTAHIVAVDRFFTDDTTFPVPAHDPAYIASQLLSYNNKLRDDSTIRKLIFFLLPLAHRAAKENQHDRLTCQLIAAMTHGSEDAPTPTLRAVLLQAVFPAYIQLAISSPCGWLFARPIISASTDVLNTMIYKFTHSDPAGRATALTSLSATLSVLHSTLQPLLHDLRTLRQPHVLRVLAPLIRLASAVLPTLIYLQRMMHVGAECMNSVQFMRAFTVIIAQLLMEREPTLEIINPLHRLAALPEQYDDVRRVCHTELERVLRDSWVFDEGQHKYYVLKNRERQEVDVPAMDYAVVKAEIVDAIEEYHTILHRMKGLGI